MSTLYRIAALTLLLAQVGLTHARADRIYSVTDLGFGEGVALNDNGYVLLNQNGQATLWRDGTTQTLFQGTATGLNNLDEVTGESNLNRAILVRGGTIRDLGPGYAAAVNDQGVVLLGNNGEFSYWEDGIETSIPDLTGTSPYAMNDSGAIVGADSAANAFFYDSSGINILGYGYAGDINNSGNYIYTFIGTFEDSMFIRIGADEIPLGLLSPDHTNADASGLNSFDQVVGRSGNRGFLWQNSVMQDLNDLILPEFQSDWTIFAARDINDLGDILASAIDTQGRVHTVLLREQLTPTVVPEPSSLALGLIGLACGGWLWRRRGSTPAQLP